MVPLDSHEVSRASQYSGTGCVLFSFGYGAITRCGRAFQLSSPAYSRIAYAGPTTPNGRNHSVWALPISLAATLGVSFDFSSPGTEMFHFPGLASLGLCIQPRMMGHDSHRVSPFRNHRIVGCLAPPRCLSQLTASFIASQRQGIHLLPLISYFSRTLLFPSHSPIQL